MDQCDLFFTCSVEFKLSPELKNVRKNTINQYDGQQLISRST